MGTEPQWTVQCRVCKATFGPLHGSLLVGRLLDGDEPLACGHHGADVLSQKM